MSEISALFGWGPGVWRLGCVLAFTLRAPDKVFLGRIPRLLRVAPPLSSSAGAEALSTAESGAPIVARPGVFFTSYLRRGRRKTARLWLSNASSTRRSVTAVSLRSITS